MHGEIPTTSRTAEFSPLEIELRNALGFMANLAARVELAKDLGEIDENAAERVGRIANHLGAAAARIGQIAGVPTETAAQNGHNTNGHANGQSQNGHGSNGHTSGHTEGFTGDHASSNGHTHTDLSSNGKSHGDHQEPSVEHEDQAKTGSDAELFIDIPDIIKENFSADEYKTFSERDVAIALHFLERRGSQTSVKDLVNKLAPAGGVQDTTQYDTLRKGVSTSLKKLRTTELGQRCLRDNGQPTKARRYMLLTDAEALEYPDLQVPPTLGDPVLSPEETEALSAKREKLFSGFQPCNEDNPTGDIPCTVLSETKLQIGNQVYEYQLTGKRVGNKNTTVGMYNGLVELLVRQGKAEIKPGELTELLGLSGTGAVGRAFDNLTRRFDVFPFVRTGTARATRYFRNPDFYFINELTDGEPTTVVDTHETVALPLEAETARKPEIPEYPKQLELTEWGLFTNVEQNDDSSFTHTIYLSDKPLQLRDITISTLLVLAASRQSIMQADLLEAVMTLVPDMTDEKLRGCLHEIRNCFEYNDIDKHLYRRQLPERDGTQEILWNLNGIIDGNGVSDFLALSSVIDQ